MDSPRIRAKQLREMAALWRQVAPTLSLRVEREKQLMAAKALEAEADRLEIGLDGTKPV